MMPALFTRIVGHQLLGDPCHGRVDLIGGRHIAAHADRPAAIGRDPVGNGDTGRLVEVENGDGVAVLAKRAAVAAPMPRAAPVTTATREVLICFGVLRGRR